MEILADDLRGAQEKDGEYTYLTLPPVAELRSCVGLVLAGLVTRAGIGLGNLEESVEVLEDLHPGDAATSYRFFIGEERVYAEVWDSPEKGPSGAGWRTVVELAA